MIGLPERNDANRVSGILRERDKRDPALGHSDSEPSLLAVVFPRVWTGKEWM